MSMSWDIWLRVFHLSGKCCMNWFAATKEDRLELRLDSVGKLGFKVYTELYF